MDISPDYSHFTLDQVEQWAGADLTVRARSYVRRVDDLRLAPGGRLLGWVEGSARYATQVWPDDHGTLRSSCTCGSARATCKHAAGLLLAAMFRLRDGSSLPVATADDIRLGSSELAFLPIEQVADSRLGHHGAFPERLVKAIGRLRKGELVDLLAGLAEENREVAELIAIRLDPEGRTPAEQIAWLRDTIQAAAERPGWKDPRSGEQFTPDYGPVERGLTALVEKCGAVHVVTLGEELCLAANQQLAETEDDGETRTAIIECLAVVLAALEISPLSPVEKVCWYWDRLIDDPYHLFQALDQPDVIEALKKKQWRKVAANCREQLGQLPDYQQDEAWRTRHRRNGMLEYATTALQRAGDNQAITVMLIDQLPHSANYPLLIDHLCGIDQAKQAEQWAVRGFHTLQQCCPTDAWRLVDRLADLQARQSDPTAAAALRVEQFLHQPSPEGLRVATQLTPPELRDGVRRGLTAWLASGEHPRQSPQWPLPDSPLDVHDEPIGGRLSFPHYALLIELALEDGDHDQAVDWYRRAPAHANQAQRIAEAVKESHPEISLSIWSQRVEALVHEARTADYARAKPYLEGIRDLHARSGNATSANAWFQKLRRRHKAKRRLLEVMDEVQTGR